MVEKIISLWSWIKSKFKNKDTVNNNKSGNQFNGNITGNDNITVNGDLNNSNVSKNNEE